jgi:uncharacterized protein (DUF1778 family)
MPSRISKKAERLNIRATVEEKQLIEQAAETARMTTSQFVLQAAVRSAEKLLGDAERTRYLLSDREWDEFAAALDRPAREIPSLKRALSKRSPFRGQ